MPSVSTEVPDESTRDAVRRLADRIEAEDGAPPLSDEALTQLRSPDVDHVTARDGGKLVVGYAQRHDGSAEIAAEPAAVEPLLDAVTQPGLLVWSHGRHSRLGRILAARGFEQVRKLHQLRRSLTALPDEPPLPPGVQVRAFRPGTDEDAWLAVNAAAFRTHPEQGHVRRADLEARMAEPWFDAAGFLLAESGGELLGFHWTKVHPDGLGEVYVLGIGPAAQGLGLGKGLLARGLRHLADRGCPAVLLYVEDDNAGARQLYAHAGFDEYDRDVQWRAP
ncbi:MAG TPA: mycothiol synthase [Jatrophihabitans sp.]|jgi:mycothiol synthase|nr:mycothiol synthase [Jatrophihabitans sp.]